MSFWVLKICIFILFISGVYSGKIYGKDDRGKEKLRVCIVEGRGAYKKAEKFCPILEQASNIECVIAVDRLDCVRRIHKGSAHFGVFSSEDLVAARWSSVEILVTNEMRFHNSHFEYEVVAVVDNEAEIHSAQDLRGSKFCHPGHALENHWTEILANYFESTLVSRQCEPELTLAESRIKASAKFFGPTCKAGPWVPDPVQDRILKNRYPSLCEICYDSYRCGVGDKHWGRRGALYCLTSGAGEVSWARLDDVRSHFGFSGLPAEANPNEYSFLCPDGHLQPLNSSHPCVWVAKPWPAVAAQRKYASRIQDLVTNLSHDDNSWQHALLSLLETYHVNVTTLDSTITIDDYLDQAVGFQSAYSFPACSPPRSIVYCTTSIIQHTKCSWLQEASSVYGIEPNLQCIRGETLDRCLDDIKHKAADVVLVDQDSRMRAQLKYNLRPILYEYSQAMHEKYVTIALVRSETNHKTLQDIKGRKACFPSFQGAAYLSVLDTIANQSISMTNIEEFFSTDSCIWNSNGLRDCDHSYRGDEGALKCLADGADVAFLSYDIYKNFTTGTLNSTWLNSISRKAFRPLCLYENKAKNTKMDMCYLHWTPRGHLMVHNQTNLMRRNEIYNSLRDMDRLFGKQSRAHVIPFTMFGPFDKRNNIMFRDNTEGLRGIIELRKDRSERLMEDVYDRYINEKYFRGSACVSSLSKPLILILAFISIVSMSFR